MGAREVFGTYNKEYVFDLATLSYNMADDNTNMKDKPFLVRKSS